MENLQEHLDFAIETAHTAGQIALEHYQHHIHTDIKKDGSYVTDADKKIESYIQNRVKTAYPKHDFIGEEFGYTIQNGAGLRWIVDPIDGTRAFSCGVPLFSTLIALEVDHIPVIGVAYFPALELNLYAAKGLGSFLNGKRIHVNDQISSISEGVVTFTNELNFKRHGLSEPWQNIRDMTGYLGGWGDAYGYYLVATGKTALHIEPYVQVWDCAPFIPIIQEAGGYMGDWQGHETILSHQSMAMPKQILPEVLALINGQ